MIRRHFSSLHAAGVVFSLLLSSAPAAAQTATIAKTELDLGTVGYGTEPTAAFEIKNSGSAPLTLDVLHVPAGLKLAHADSPIAPGATGEVRFTVDTFKAGETLSWQVSIATNDTAMRIINVTVRADVRQFLMLAPDASRIIFVQSAKAGGTSHTIVALDEQPMEVTRVESPLPFISASLRELPESERRADLPARRQWRIDLTIAPDAPVGPIGGVVTVYTTHPKQPRAFIAVSGFVRPLFAITPPSAKLAMAGPVDGDKPMLTLVVKNFGEDAVEIKGVSTDVEGLKATLIPVDAGHIWRVELRMANGGKTGTFKGTVTLATTSATVPEVRVPVEGTRDGK